MKKRKIFKKLFILLPNIQMTTNTLNSFNPNVVTDDTNKNGKKWLLWLANLALWGTLLFGKVSDWNAQEVVTQERNEATKEFVVSKTQAEIDSITSYDEAKQLLNGEKREISAEEIQEYLESHKEELIKKIDQEKMDNIAREFIYEKLMNDKKIQSIVSEMVNDKEIQQAILEWNEDYYIHEVLQKKLENKFETGWFLKFLWVLDIIWLILDIIIGIVRMSNWRSAKAAFGCVSDWEVPEDYKTIGSKK